jgi:DNA-binding Lrp family transcriptional regulator
MSKIGAVIQDIDEALIEAMQKRVEPADLLNIAEKLGVPFKWVEDRYNELSADW